MKRGKFVQLMAHLALVVVLLLSTAVATNAAPKPQYGGVLKIIDDAEGAQPNGAPWEVASIDHKLQKPAVETLVREDIRGNYHPWLATSWKVDTKTNAITVSLRKGVKFHDGTDFNAAAVKWCLDQAIAGKKCPGWVSVDVIDDCTIRVNVERYQNNYLNYLASTAGGGIVSPLTFQKRGADFARWNPVGTGPFKFVSFERGAKLVYTRWDGYWQKGKPYLDGIEFLFIRDPMTQQAAMRATGSEKVQVLAVTSGEQAMMMKSLGLQVLSMPIGPVSLIPDSNNSDSPLANKKVREAVSYAIDREAIVKARGFGYWASANQIPSPGQPGYVKNLDFGRYDPKKAKQLLAEAGYPNGLKLTLIVQPALVDRDAMVAVQRYLSEVGVQVDLQFPDGGGFTAIKWKNGWHNGFVVNHTRMFATINITYNFYVVPDSGQFISQKRTDGVLDKLASSLRTVSPEDAKGQEMTKMMADDAMFIPLYYVYEMYAIQPNVHDTGYCEWSSTSVSTPEAIWMSK